MNTFRSFVCGDRMARSCGTAVPGPMTSPDDDPLRQYRFRSRDLAIPFPRPGRYDLLMLAQGTEIARYPLLIAHAETQID